jgi:hypothetical protein
MAIKASLIEVHLGMVAQDIAGARQKMTEARTAVAYVNSVLTAIGSPTGKYAPMIAAVNAPAYGADANEAANKAMLAALTAEFIALNAAVVAAQTALTSGVTEY